MAGRKRQTTDQEILRKIALSPDPIATAPELAAELGISRQGLNPRLHQLVDSGVLEKRTVGSRAAVYWLTDDGRQALA